MKLIPNLDDTKKQLKKDVEFQVVENERRGYQTADWLFIDPVVDGLIFFRHPDAPWDTVAEKQAKVLADLWWDLPDFDLLHVKPDVCNETNPGYTFMTFPLKIRCWKNYGRCIAGYVYAAHIKDFFGFGYKGFIVDGELEYVDSVVDAINHFVLA